MRSFLGFLIGIVVRLWVATFRLRLAVDPALDLGDTRPLVFAFWHGGQMPLLALRRRPTAVLVSLSRDGKLQSGVMRALGLNVVRGSSSRAGASGLRAMIRALRAGRDAAFAVDGPRGPQHQAKPGAAGAALLAGGLLVPVAGASRHTRVLSRAWDRFEVPLPFTRVVVVAGAPVEARLALSDSGVLERAIDAARRRALALLEADGGALGAGLDGRASLS